MFVSVYTLKDWSWVIHLTCMVTIVEFGSHIICTNLKSVGLLPAQEPSESVSFASESVPYLFLNLHLCMLSDCYFRKVISQCENYASSHTPHACLPREFMGPRANYKCGPLHITYCEFCWYVGFEGFALENFWE